MCTTVTFVTGLCALGSLGEICCVLDPVQKELALQVLYSFSLSSSSHCISRNDIQPGQIAVPALYSYLCVKGNMHNSSSMLLQIWHASQYCGHYQCRPEDSQQAAALGHVAGKAAVDWLHESGVAAIRHSPRGCLRHPSMHASCPAEQFLLSRKLSRMRQARHCCDSQCSTASEKPTLLFPMKFEQLQSVKG